MRSIVVLSSERIVLFSEPTSASASSSTRAPSCSVRHAGGGRELAAAGLAFVLGDEAVVRPVDRALGAAQRARRPVVAAQLVEHGAVDARPRELLERRALRGVVALDRADQGLQAAGEEVLDVTLRRDLADLAVDDVADHRGEGEDQAVPEPDVPGALVLLP